MMIRRAPAGHHGDLAALDHRTALSRAFYGDLDGRFDRNVWYAEVDGEVVGMAMTGPPHDILGPWVGELYQLQVHADHRRKGIGSQLHDACVAAWRTRGVTVGVLEVPADDEHTQAFFESHGWRQDGHTRQSFEGITYLRLRRTIN